MIFDYESTGESIRSRVQAIVKNNKVGKTKFPYSPIRFIARHKIVASDKLLVAFDALALFEAWHELPPIGRIVYGQGCGVMTLRISGLVNQVRRSLRSMQDLFKRDSPPVLR